MCVMGVGDGQVGWALGSLGVECRKASAERGAAQSLYLTGSVLCVAGVAAGLGGFCMEPEQ